MPPSRPQRSLRHEYELYVEEEIEKYKESLPRSALLGIGDEAAKVLAADQQMGLTELLLCEEVDRIIRKRLRLSSYRAWRRQRIKLLAELRRPEHWGLQADDAVVSALRAAADSRVLVAGARDERTPLYLAALGCEVTTIDTEQDALERVLDAANEAGLGGHVHAQIADLSSWSPAAPLSAVVCAPAALGDLTAAQRAQAIDVLQRATAYGGIHLLHTAAAADPRRVPIDELRVQYGGWEVSVESFRGAPDTFLARKSIS
jgi:tellurite resistance protein TehB